MEKLKREIGYRPPPTLDNLKDRINVIANIGITQPPQPNFTTSIPMEVKDIIELQKTVSKKITKWIKDHPDFKWTRMCKSVGIDKGSFSRIINSEEPVFKLEHIPLIENKIKEYGYT